MLRVAFDTLCLIEGRSTLFTYRSPYCIDGLAPHRRESVALAIDVSLILTLALRPAGAHRAAPAGRVAARARHRGGHAGGAGAARERARGRRAAREPDGARRGHPRERRAR